MDPVSGLAAAFVASKAAELQMALAARFAKMNASSEQSIAQLLEAANQNMQKLADAAAGLGQNIDIQA
jgi:hypothetical protein